MLLGMCILTNSLKTQITVDSNKTTNFRCFTRERIDTIAAPFKPKRLKLFWDGVESPGFVYRPYGPDLRLSALTDIWFEAYGDGGASMVSVDFELLVCDV